MSPAIPRPDMRRAVVLLPNGFTLGNLFFGVFAIVSAARGEFMWAGWCVVLGGVMDALDGQVARMTRTGSRFGIELDSLVDAVSFGVAPAIIMYFAVLNRDGWAWIFAFIFVACVVMRLARFNVEQGGRAKTHFHGLPSPAAGMTLATYYWFSQTKLYTETIIGDLPWHTVLPAVMLTLSLLMISHVLYPAVPRLGFRNLRSTIGTVILLGIVGVVLLHPYRFAFPALVLYVAYGLAQTIFFGVVDRLPTGDPLFDEEDEEEDVQRPVAIGEVPGGERRRRRRGRRRSDRRPILKPRIEETGE
ncbi:MAG TPA: CDP-diacylglycerol--serine O-phosphatidyltransferase [Gemmatimonadaceae bacterium]|nr:CDP-diacylglycerol--serine O-phosphatidyltransferase [Gemmatimonadaceae bacterium]